MPTQLFVFVYWEKGYTNPIRCQRAWAAHRNSTLKGGAATERDGKGLDALATNFNLLTRLASHYPFALFVGDNHVATRGYALQFEDALLVGPTLTAGAEIIYSGLFENNQRVFGRPAGANDLPGDLHSFGALHRKISLHLVPRLCRNHLCLTDLHYSGVVHRGVFTTEVLPNPIVLINKRYIVIGFE